MSHIKLCIFQDCLLDKTNFCNDHLWWGWQSGGGGGDTTLTSNGKQINLDLGKNLLCYILFLVNLVTMEVDN